jgi:hypothetical protein
MAASGQLAPWIFGWAMTGNGSMAAIIILAPTEMASAPYA